MQNVTKRADEGRRFSATRGFDYIPAPGDGVAWVTGASAGIGRALTLALAREGWTVYATARGADSLADLARENPNIRPLPGDVRDVAAMRACVATVAAERPLALAVLNAGIYHPMRAQEYDADKAREIIEVNQIGVSNCLDPVLRQLLAQECGCVALVASVAGYRGLPRAAPYSGTKAALIAMAEALAFDLAPRGIRIAVINPGFVATGATSVNSFEMPFLIQPEEAARQIVRGLKRPGFEIAFPWRMVLATKAMKLFGARSYVALVSRAIGWDKVED